jgi:hypothetical protein
MTAHSPESAAGAEVLHGDAAVYTRPVLAIYDPIALGMVCPIAWRCSRRVMLEHYNRNIRGVHLDIGPGTGFLLDRCRFPTPNPSIVIADLNETVLETVSRRIARHRPVALRRDALHPLDLGDRRFESVAIQNILHCLRAPWRRRPPCSTTCGRTSNPAGGFSAVRC